MKIASIVILAWLVVGAVVGTQRDYFKSDDNNCRETSDVVVTVLAGPLNYFGINDKTTCE